MTPDMHEPKDLVALLGEIIVNLLKGVVVALALVFLALLLFPELRTW